MRLNLNIVSVSFLLIASISTVQQSKISGQRPPILPSKSTTTNLISLKLQKNRRLPITPTFSPVIRFANDEISIDSDKPEENKTNAHIEPTHESENNIVKLDDESDEQEEHQDGDNSDQDFTLKDIKEINHDLFSIRDIIRKEVLSNLSITLILKKLEISYQMYKKLNEIRRAYFEWKSVITKHIDRIKSIVANSKNQLEIMEKLEDVEQIFKTADAKVDNYNKKILMQLVLSLDENVATLHTALVEDLDDFFVDMRNIHYDLTITDEEKVSKLIKVAINISTFEIDVLNDKIEKVEAIRGLILDNPKYHHLSDINNPNDDLDEDTAHNLGDPSSETSLICRISLIIIGGILIVSF